MNLLTTLARASALLLVVCIAAEAQSYVNFEGKQTSPIRLSADGKLLFAVNTPDGRLSVFNVSNPDNPIHLGDPRRLGAGFRQSTDRRRGLGRQRSL